MDITLSTMNEDRIWKALKIDYSVDSVWIGGRTERLCTWKRIPREVLKEIRDLINQGELDEAIKLYGEKYMWGGK